MADQLLAADMQPYSELVVPAHHVPQSKYPSIDAHTHVWIGPEGISPSDVPAVLAEMDASGLQALVNLSGGWGEQLKRTLEVLDQAYPGRFATLCNVDWEHVCAPGWLERTLRQFEADVRAGARGLKIYKELGLRYRDPQGQLVLPDDPRLAPLWARAGELGVPVLIHSADPVAFFKPLDGYNERWDELHRHPHWHFYGPQFPPFEEVIAALYHTIESHPQTTFIAAHVGCYPENLDFVGRMLECYPNLYTDFSARIAELGRAPYSARRWFMTYPDRILFGTDGMPSATECATYYRFLETADEYFPYVDGAPIPTQGRWRIYGLYLPDDVLRKVYHDNAARLFGLS